MDPLQNPSDAELLRGIADGGELACRLFYRRWAPRLGRFLCHATGGSEVASDLLQETFLRVLRAAPRFEAQGSASAWVYRIAANLAYSHWRRQRGRARWITIDADGLDVPSPAPDPEQDSLRQAWMRDARRAVDELPENHRLVFLLKIDAGLTYDEIGETLGCPTGTAKSRFHHAVRRLRTTLRDWEGVDLGVARERPPAPRRDVHVV